MKGGNFLFQLDGVATRLGLHPRGDGKVLAHSQQTLGRPLGIVRSTDALIGNDEINKT